MCLSLPGPIIFSVAGILEPEALLTEQPVFLTFPTLENKKREKERSMSLYRRKLIKPERIKTLLHVKIGIAKTNYMLWNIYTEMYSLRVNSAYPMRYIFIILSFYRWKTWGSERVLDSTQSHRVPILLNL